jgi:pantothenate kinase-related protein Tda10
MIGQRDSSYSCWASFFTKVTGKLTSKQSIFNRINDQWVSLIKLLVCQTLEKIISESSKIKTHPIFNNIYLQDSTSISLPEILKSIFPGNISRGKKKAVAKINTIINLTHGVCRHLGIMSYSMPEQRLSDSIFNFAKAGDLVIRDMGYFVLNVFEMMNKRNIYFISRLPFHVGIYKNGKKIKTTELFKNKKIIDTNVFCGTGVQLPVRIIAIKLNPIQAAEKIRKAKQDRNKRLNHSKEYYKNLEYLIFITNVEIEKCDGLEIAKFYRMRWQVEILFKSWKSGMNIENLIPEARQKTERIESILYLFLLYIMWFERKIMTQLNIENISILKLIKELIRNIEYYLTEALNQKNIKELEYRCRYETRSRVNAKAAFSMFGSSFD